MGRVGLVQHTLISVTGRTRFIGINAGNDDDFIFHLLLAIRKRRHKIRTQNLELSIPEVRLALYPDPAVKDLILFRVAVIGDEIE
jgi:hypothetical protein